MSSIPEGRQFGRYVIRAKLGAGGMAEVFLADDTAARPPRRPETPAAGDGGRSPRASAPAARGARGCHARSSAHLRRLRGRRSRRPPVHRDAIRRGRNARRAAAPVTARAARDPVDRRSDRRRPERRARARHPASRHQARQHHGHDARRCQGHGLRPRQARSDRRRVNRGRGNDVGVEPSGRHCRHGGVHVARAGPRRTARSAQRSLQRRRAALRDGERPAAVPGRELGGARRGDSDARAVAPGPIRAQTPRQSSSGSSRSC